MDGQAGSGASRRRLLAVAGLVLAGALGACSSDPTAEASAEGGADATYADGSTESSDSAPAGTADTKGDAAPVEETPAPGSVAVTYWHWNTTAGTVEVAGFVDGLTEDGGTCTLTLTRGATVLTGDGPALSDAASTSCGMVEVTVPAGNAGDWEAVLAYESPTASASSDTFTVTAS
jgi:hypothetical protein